MKGQHLLDETLSGLKPDCLVAMREAFDLSWSIVAKRYHHEAAVSEARVSLANIVVSLVEHGVTDIADICRISIDLIDIVDSYRHK